MMQQMAATNTILQTVADEDKRGRLMSFYSMAFMGTAPFGSLAAGAVADRIGAPKTLMISGVVCMVGALWFRTQLPHLACLHEVDKTLRTVRAVSDYVRRAAAPAVAAGPVGRISRRRNPTSREQNGGLRHSPSNTGVNALVVPGIHVFAARKTWMAAT